jgi:hypothetical protein
MNARLRLRDGFRVAVLPSGRMPMPMNFDLTKSARSIAALGCANCQFAGR